MIIVFDHPGYLENQRIEELFEKNGYAVGYDEELTMHIREKLS